jgi:hypothetical protein
MPPTPESRARPADPPRVNDYDSFAGAYTAENESSVWNAYYERPAMLELARRRLGDDAALPVANLGRPLPFDTHHPGLIGHKTDYFATYNWTEEWTMGGQSTLMSFWERPLHAMTDAFITAGFLFFVLHAA